MGRAGTIENVGVKSSGDFGVEIILQHDELLPKGYRFKDDGLLHAHLVERVAGRVRMYWVKASSIDVDYRGMGKTVRAACKDFLDGVVVAYEAYRQAEQQYKGRASTIAKEMAKKIGEYIEKVD